MTVTGDDPSQQPSDPGPQPPEGSQAARSGRRRDMGAVLEVCPFLAVETGAWRSAYAAREHRCHAVRPPAALAITKQRQLCLLSEHVTCATYVAARAVAAEALPPTPGDSGAALWSGTASTPVVLEPARRMGALPGGTARSGGQALLVGLMVLAFIVLVIARAQSPAASGAATPAPTAAGGAVASPSASIEPPSADPSVAAASPSSSAVADPTPSPAITPEPSPAPTPEPPAATQTYKVKSGDTLSTIAARYGTTVKAIATLNGIPDPRFLRIGQVLVIP